MDTYSQALVNFHTNKKPHNFEIVRDDGFSSIVPVSLFFDDISFPEIESLALSNCTGKILDVGAGVGRHSSELQRRGLNVTAIDMSEHAVAIMKERGIAKTACGDIFEYSGLVFDTLLMLMNGIGIAGNHQRLDHLLITCHKLLAKKGIIIVESIDVFKSSDTTHKQYRELNIAKLKYPGQQNLRIDYDGVLGSWFEWLHLTFKELKDHAEKNDFVAELLMVEEDGRYLAKLQKRS